MNERREYLQQQRELDADRRHERIVLLYGLLALIPAAVIIYLRVAVFL